MEPLRSPYLHIWADHADGPLRLIEQDVPRPPTDHRDPKALACYGVLLQQVRQPECVWLHNARGPPVSALAEQFLGWCCRQLQETGRAHVDTDLGQFLLACQ